VLRN
jgi:hypothetical protein